MKDFIISIIIIASIMATGYGLCHLGHNTNCCNCVDCDCVDCQCCTVK